MNDSIDHFERLGLPRRFSVDLAEVEVNYLDRSRTHHPDFHTLAGVDDQHQSLKQTAALNEAYLALKDPFRRAEYLVTLLGGPTGQREKNLDQAFLMEMMDYRERIEESRSNGVGLLALERELTERRNEVGNQIAEHFQLVETDVDDARWPHLVAIRRFLNAAKTMQSLLRDLREI